MNTFNFAAYCSGMNTWGVSKLHEAAEKLKVPGWIVDIRLVQFYLLY